VVLEIGVRPGGVEVVRSAYDATTRVLVRGVEVARWTDLAEARGRLVLEWTGETATVSEALGTDPIWVEP
jgi:hypothetical protein